MVNLNTDNATGKNHEGMHANIPLKFLTATSIIGDKVFNEKEEHMGNIKDIMLDVNTGKIEYVIIEVGGFLGIGEKYFALPFSTLVVDAENQSFILQQEQETLKNAPGFDKDHWPQTNDHYYDSSTYWGGFMGSNTGGM